MEAKFKNSALKWLKKNPKLAQDFLNIHLPKILKDPYKVGSKLQTNMNLYSYHFHRKPEYRAIYQIESDVIIFLIASREDVYKDLKKML